MTDQILTTSAQASMVCAQLPGREIGLARREMMNASGGLIPIGIGVNLTAMARVIAEAVFEYFDETD